jgi:hypothetical protein
MYTAPQKRFRPRDEAEIFEAIKRCSALYGGDVRRVFLADGDAMTLFHATPRSHSRSDPARNA